MKACGPATANKFLEEIITYLLNNVVIGDELILTELETC